MPKKKLIVLLTLISLFTASFIHLNKNKFQFKNGAYKTYVIDDEIHPLGITDFIYGHQGYHFIYDSDSLAHENCEETRDKFNWEIDQKNKQLILDNYEVWHKDSCGDRSHVSEPFKQYFNIVHQTKDSVVTKHYKDIVKRETHFYHKTDTSLYIWVWNSKLTDEQKEVIK